MRSGGPRWLRPAVLAMALVAVTVLAAPPAGAQAPARSRLYLLAGPGLGHNIWSTTAADTEAAEAAKTAQCEVSAQRFSTFPCRTVWSPFKTTYQALGFSAGARVDDAIAWEADEVSFHLEMAIDSPAEPEVAVFIEGDDTVHPATQTAPGVWEGRLRSAGSLSSRSNTSILVGVRSTTGFLAMSIKTAGASWFDFPTPFAAQSGPEVVGANPAGRAPTLFASAERTFRFNDGDWEVRSFSGQHDVAQSIALPLGRDATAVHVYVEGFSDPPLYTVTHGEGRGLSLTDQPRVRIAEADGHVLSTGARAAALTDVPAGTYQIEIATPVTWAGITGPPPVAHSYVGYAVVVYGERTLAGMRFGFPPSAVASFNTPAARNFPPRSEHVPVPGEATSLVPVLTAKRVGGVHDSWAMSYGGHSVSGGAWSGQRLFVHEPDVFVFGVTPMAEDQVATQDVKFFLDVRYTYSPLPT